MEELIVSFGKEQSDLRVYEVVTESRKQRSTMWAAAIHKNNLSAEKKAGWYE